jgi:hypothetical protein
MKIYMARFILFTLGLAAGTVLFLLTGCAGYTQKLDAFRTGDLVIFCASPEYISGRFNGAGAVYDQWGHIYVPCIDRDGMLTIDYWYLGHEVGHRLNNSYPRRIRNPDD